MKKFMLSVVAVMVLVAGCFGGGEKLPEVGNPPEIEIMSLNVTNPNHAKTFVVVSNKGGDGYFNWRFHAHWIYAIYYPEFDVVTDKILQTKEEVFIKEGEVMSLWFPLEDEGDLPDPIPNGSNTSLNVTFSIEVPETEVKQQKSLYFNIP